MDFSKLTLGSKLINGAGFLLLIDSFLHWQSVSVLSANMWHGWGVLAGLILLAILALEGAQLSDVKIAVGPLGPSLLTMVLSALLVLVTLIKVLADSYVASMAWIGLVLTVVVAVGAWLNMQVADESLADLRSTVVSAGANPSSPAAATEADAPDAGSGSIDAV